MARKFSSFVTKYSPMLDGKTPGLCHPNTDYFTQIMALFHSSECVSPKQYGMMNHNYWWSKKNIRTDALNERKQRLLCKKSSGWDGCTSAYGQGGGYSSLMSCSLTSPGTAQLFFWVIWERVNWHDINLFQHQHLNLKSFSSVGHSQGWPHILKFLPLFTLPESL